MTEKLYFHYNRSTKADGEKTLQPVSQVFRKHVLSYLAVVLAICMVLGLALVRVSTDQLRQAEMEVYQTRLAQTGDYPGQYFK